MARAKNPAPWLKDVLSRAETGAPAFDPSVVKVIALEALSMTAPEPSSLRARFGIYAATAEAELRRAGNAPPPEEDEDIAPHDEASLAGRWPRRLGDALATFAVQDCDRAFVLEAERAGGLTAPSNRETNVSDKCSPIVQARVSVAELPEALTKSTLMRQVSAVLPKDARF